MDRRNRIKAATAFAGKRARDLATATGLSESGFSQRLSNDSLKEDDMKKIADALGAKYIECFEFPDGTRI